MSLIGHNNPPPDRMQVMPPTPVRDILGRLPYKFLAALEENEKLYACCRQAREHRFETCKTEPALPAADMGIFTCNCGRKHYRLAVGPGKMGG